MGTFLELHGNVFDRYDTLMVGEISIDDLFSLYREIRPPGIRYAQVVAGVETVYGEGSDSLQRFEFEEALRELDRRYFLLQDLYWEYQCLANNEGLISEPDTRLLFEATHEAGFSLLKYKKWLRSRVIKGSDVSFNEIDVLLCNKPSTDDIIAELPTVPREKSDIDFVRSATTVITDKTRSHARQKKLEKLSYLKKLQELKAKRSDNLKQRRDIKDEVKQQEEEKKQKEQDELKKKKEEEEQARIKAEEAARIEEAKQQEKRDAEKRLAEEESRRKEAEREKELQRKEAERLEEEKRQEKERKEEEERQEMERREEEERQEIERKEEERRQEAERKRKEAEEEKRRLEEEAKEAERIAMLEAERENERVREKLLKSKNESEMAEELSKKAEEELAKAHELNDAAAIEEAERKKKEAEKAATKANVLKKLTQAIENRDITSLEEALAEVKKKKVEGIEDTVKEAEDLLKMLYCGLNLENAVRDRDIESIESAIAKVKKETKHNKRHYGGYDKILANKVHQAETLLVKLKRLEFLKRQVMELKQQTIAELKSYQQPPPIVKFVMTATFLILGHNAKNIQKWNQMVVLMGKTGKEALKRRVQQFEPDNMSWSVAKACEDILAGMDTGSVADVSAGAAAFYVWCNGMVEERLSLPEEIPKDLKEKRKHLDRRKSNENLMKGGTVEVMSRRSRSRDRIDVRKGSTDASRGDPSRSRSRAKVAAQNTTKKNVRDNKKRK